MASCLVCSAEVADVLSFGKMPIANGFLNQDEFANEHHFELQVGFCPICSMVQLTRLVEPDKLFHDNYAYFSSTSVRMAEHFRNFAEQAYGLLPKRANPFVVEIGSNDGILLLNFARSGVRHLGVEPSGNVAQEAVKRGVNTRCSFFDQETAAEILREDGPADAILGANVISHIPDIHSVLSGVDLLLKESGVFVFEEPYLGDIVEKTAYDQFYDEHVFYFSLASLSNALVQHNMVVVDAMAQPVHGGSMRYIVARKGVRPVKPEVEALQASEASLGLDQRVTFRELQGRINRSRDQLTGLLKGLKQENKRIVGYGATSKSTTVTNYCGIGPDLIDFISDTTPGKQGKYSPGTHIPVRPYADFLASYPDYALLFAWNHSEEIMAKEQAFFAQGGRFISYVPEVRVLE